MRFREFLLLEAGFSDSGSDWFYGSALLPSDAFDWEDAQPHPADFSLLQSRWKKERDEWGRKFHNLDLDGVLKTKYTAVYSNTMPEVGDGFWQHKPDKRPNLSVDTNAKMLMMAHRDKAEVHKELFVSNDLIDNTDKLNRMFGTFKPNYYELPSNFDEPWLNQKMEYKPRKKNKKLNNI